MMSLAMGDGEPIYLPRISAADFEAFRRLLKNEIAPTFEIWVERHKKSKTA